MAAKTWEQGIIDAALKDLHKEWGTAGWDYLGADLRAALLCRKVLAVIAHQDVEGDDDAKKARRLDTAIALATRALRTEV